MATGEEDDYGEEGLVLVTTLSRRLCCRPGRYFVRRLLQLSGLHLNVEELAGEGGAWRRMANKVEGGTGGQFDKGAHAGRRVAEEVRPRGRWKKRHNLSTFLSEHALSEKEESFCSEIVRAETQPNASHDRLEERMKDRDVAGLEQDRENDVGWKKDIRVGVGG